ncbi:MAG: glycosyltransferase [Gemmataceae bacterium]
MAVISIITATRNYARFLPEAIDSVLAQTFRDWELIVIDDGSTDETPSVVASYLKDNRIRYVRSDRLGQSRAKNLGISLSCGEYVAFLDGDDIWEANKLERQLPKFTETVKVVFSRRSVVDGTGQPITGRREDVLLRGQLLNEIFIQNFICFSSVVVRRSLFDEVGRFDEGLDLAIDYDFWLRAAHHTEFDYVDERLVRYRTGHGNLSQRVADRVATACTIMESARRRGSLMPSTVAEGYASTLRTLGYIVRRSDPMESMRCYSRALRWPHQRLMTLRGLLAAFYHHLFSPRLPGCAENAVENR